jgi:hypothetical protein
MLRSVSSWLQSFPTAKRRSSARSTPRGADGDKLAPAHDPDRVAEPEELGQVGADEDDRLSRRGQAPDDLVDLRLAADVDPAGGLVEEQDRSRGARGGAPGRPSAGCRRRARRRLWSGVAALDRELAGPQRLAAAPGGRLIQPSRPKAPSFVSVMLSRIGWFSMRPSSLRFSLRKPRPRPSAPGRGGAGSPTTATLPRLGPVEAEDRAQTSPCGRPRSAREPEDLALLTEKVAVFKPRLRAQPGRPRGPGAHLPRARVEVGDGPARHEATSFVDAGVPITPEPTPRRPSGRCSGRRPGGIPRGSG